MCECEVAQSYPTLCNTMDCSLAVSAVHGILQARILGWVAISFSRGSSRRWNWTWVSCVVGRWFTNWAMKLLLNLMAFFCNFPATCDYSDFSATLEVSSLIMWIVNTDVAHFSGVWNKKGWNLLKKWCKKITLISVTNKPPNFNVLTY